MLLAQRDDIDIGVIPEEGEVRAFFGVMILMGLYDYNDRREYWSEKMGHPFIRNVLTRDRFEMLVRCLHVVDSSAADYKNDQLASVRPFIDQLSDSFPRYFPHREFMTIDERLKHFTVRLHVLSVSFVCHWSQFVSFVCSCLRAARYSRCT